MGLCEGTFLGINQCVSIPITLIAAWYIVPLIFAAIVFVMFYVGALIYVVYEEWQLRDRTDEAVKGLKKLQKMRNNKNVN